MAVFWVLFDAEAEQPYIKKSTVDGSLAFYDDEWEASAAMAKNPGTDYKRVQYVPMAKISGLLEQARRIVELHDKTGTVLVVDIEALSEEVADVYAEMI